MKNQVMVWLAAASLHYKGRAPFQRRELMDEIKRLFPGANQATITAYIDINTNVSSGSYYSFSYLIRTSPGTYRLTCFADENPLRKPRWPSSADIDPSHLELWEQGVAWQREDKPTKITALQTLLQQYLRALLPAPVSSKYEDRTIVLQRDSEIAVRIAPEFLLMKTAVTEWESQIPTVRLDRELTIRLATDEERKLEATAIRIIAGVQCVFGERLGSYSVCSDCGQSFAPEHMTGSWCHGCASSEHGVVY